MSVPAPQQQLQQQQLQQQQHDVSRSADLSDLLGHVHTCWDNERRSLSRQLHDSLGSSLTALTMHLGLLMQKMPADPALQDRARQMKQLLTQIVDTNRQMQLKLWNDKLEFLGVRVALAELVQQFGEQRQMTARASLPDDELNCPRSHGIVLLHTLEEALRNIAEHAGASTVDVIVDENEDEVMLTVKDDGVGPGNPASGTVSVLNANLSGNVSGNISGNLNGKPKGKFGLRMARERAAYLGGTLTLTAGAGGGTVLTMILPKPRQDDPPQHAA